MTSRSLEKVHVRFTRKLQNCLTRKVRNRQKSEEETQNLRANRNFLLHMCHGECCSRFTTQTEVIPNEMRIEAMWWNKNSMDNDMKPIAQVDN